MTDYGCREEIFLDTSGFNTFLEHSFCIIDIPVNLFVIYLVIYKSSRKMDNIKSTLLTIQIFSTLCDINLGTFVIPYVAFPVFGYHGSGIFLLFGMHPGIPAYYTIVLLAEVGSTVIVMFENRYHYLLRKHDVGFTWVSRRFLISFNFIAPFFVIGWSYLDIPEQHDIKDYMLETIKCPTRDMVKLPFFVISKSPESFGITLIFTLLFYSFELVSFLSASVYHLHSNVLDTTISVRTRKLEKQFYYSVVAQSLIPFVLIVLPSGYAALSLYNNYYNQAANNLAIFIISSHGFAGSIATIIAYKEYRSFVTKFISRKKLLMSHESQIHLRRLPALRRNMDS